MGTDDIDLEKLMNDPEHLKKVEKAHGGSPPGYPSWVNPEDPDEEGRAREQEEDA